MDYIDIASHMSFMKEKVNKSILFTPQNSAADVLFESIQMPHWSNFVTMQDIQTLYDVATSKSLAGNFDKRKKIMDEVMANRGFKFMAGGTNRSVYRHLECPTFVAKVAVDRVGLGDNQAEQNNQRYIWPFCAKMMQVCPSGVLGFAERLKPILNRYEFNAYALQIYITTMKIVGEYVLEDIGEKFFKNWAIREGFGPCLCDLPYIFVLDSTKLICQQLLDNGCICNGEIDYDDGKNYLRCGRCGRVYEAAALRKIEGTKIGFITKGGKKPMNAKFIKDGIVLSGENSSDSIVKPAPKALQQPEKKIVAKTMHATFMKGNEALTRSETVLANTGEDTSTATFNIPSTAEVAKESVEVESEPVAAVEAKPVVFKANLSGNKQSVATPKNTMSKSNTVTAKFTVADRFADSVMETINKYDKQQPTDDLDKELDKVLNSNDAEEPIKEVEVVLVVKDDAGKAPEESKMVETAENTEISAPVSKVSETAEEAIVEEASAPEATETEAVENAESTENAELNVSEEAENSANNFFDGIKDSTEFPKSPWTESAPSIKKGKSHIISEETSGDEVVMYRQKNPYTK